MNNLHFSILPSCVKPLSIVPVKKFVFNPNVCILLNDESSFGIVPVRKFDSNTICLGFREIAISRTNNGRLGKYDVNEHVILKSGSKPPNTRPSFHPTPYLNRILYLTNQSLLGLFHRDFVHVMTIDLINVVRRSHWG